MCVSAGPAGRTSEGCWLAEIEAELGVSIIGPGQPMHPDQKFKRPLKIEVIVMFPT